MINRLLLLLPLFTSTSTFGQANLTSAQIDSIVKNLRLRKDLSHFTEKAYVQYNTFQKKEVAFLDTYAYDSLRNELAIVYSPSDPRKSAGIQDAKFWGNTTFYFSNNQLIQAYYTYFTGRERHVDAFYFTEQNNRLLDQPKQPLEDKDLLKAELLRRSFEYLKLFGDRRKG